MIEIFFHFKVMRISPTKPSADNTGDLLESCTLPALSAFVIKEGTVNALEYLLRYPQVVFILNRANISKEEIARIDISRETLLGYAKEIVHAIPQGTYITSMDILVAYLLLTEQQTKLLFNKKLKQEELLYILQWARFAYMTEEHHKPTRVHVSGNGIGDALVAGWTPETQKYTEDFTYKTLEGTTSVNGRQNEFNQILEVLQRPQINNVLLVGEPGSGKSNLVEAVASLSFAGKLPGQLNGKRVLEVMVGPLIAGASLRSDLESRLQAIIEEVSHAGNVILYIQEFQNVLGSSSYGIDLSGALLPYLQSGKIPVIAAMTTGSFKAYMEQNPLKEAFSVVKLQDVDQKVALQMIMQKVADIEQKYHVTITYNALFASVTYASRFLQDEALPGNAIKLLEEAANSVALSDQPPQKGVRYRTVLEEHVLQKVEQKAHIPLAAPEEEEKEVLLHLEEKLHQQVIGQDAAITAISEAMRRFRSGMTSTNKPISFLFLGPTGVGKTETAKALAKLYFGGEEKMIRLDMSEYADANAELRLLGAPPGAGSERGELTDKIHDNPFSLVLLDEFEKANPKILDLFLQVLEDGRLTDNKGQTVSFVNAIIIATSNAGAEFVREQVVNGAPLDKQFEERLLSYLQTNGIFKPELLNRFDDIIEFMPLGENEVAQVVTLLLDNIAKTLLEQDIQVIFDQSLIAQIAREGYDQQFGARPLRRYIQDHIEAILAQMKLKNELQRGNTLTLSVDNSGNIQRTVA